MATYNREEDIKKVLASNPGMTRAEAEKQVDRNLALNQSFSNNLSKNGFNSSLESLFSRSKISSLQNTGDNAKIAREATEGSKIGLKINETAGGFQSLTVTTNEGETVTVEPTVALMTNSIDGDGIKVTKTSGNKSEITTLTGKPTSDGFLATVVTHGSPKAIEKTIRARVTTDNNVIKTKISETSVNPTVAAEKVNVDVSKEVVVDVKQVTDNANRLLANPFGAIGELFSGSNAKSEKIVGSAGNPFANILGNLAGVLSGTLQPTSFPTVTTRSISEISKVETNPLNGSLETIPIIKANGDTNLNQVVNKSTLTSSDIKPTDEPVDLSRGLPGWQGNSTRKESYKNLFTYVNTVEELEAELRAAIIDRPMTAIWVNSTRTGKNQDVKVEDIMDRVVRGYNDTLAQYRAKGLQITPSLAARLKSAGYYDGPTMHYLIRRDGSIQRGRPLRIRVAEDTKRFGGWAQRTLAVEFVGGLNADAPFKNNIDKKLLIDQASYTPEQWKSFENICKVFRKVVPGGEAFTNDEYSGTDVLVTGFSARDWTNSRFGWETLYIGDNDLSTRYKNKLGPFEMEEISKYLPSKVAKPTVTPVETKPAPAPKPEKVADVKTGKPPVKTKEQDLTDEERLRQIEEEIDELVKENNKLMKEKGPLYGSTTNNAKIVAINEKIKVIDAQLIELEKEADEIESRLYPGTEYEKQLNSLKFDLKDAEERLANAQAETRTAPDPTRSASIQKRQAAAIESRPTRIATAKEDITRLKSEIAAIEKKQKKAIDHQKNRR